MKIRLVFLLKFLLSLAVFGQNPCPGLTVNGCNGACNGSNIVEFTDWNQVNNIASDFGPRLKSTNVPYDFHGGID